jgi:hypothetical protein
MPTEMKLWRIEKESPHPILQQKLDLESRLEEWIRKDVSLVSNDLLVIAQQVPTAYGGSIDLLAIDPLGNLVILELKRDKTPRDIVAQILDYASWVEELGHEAIEEIASNFLNQKLEQAFIGKFESDLPDVLNERHRMYVVASALDSASERIVKYLSETHNVDINVVTFAFFQTGDAELLGRSLLLDEAEVQIRAESKSKRKPPRTWKELQALAEQHGVLPLYDKALAELRPFLDGMNRTRTNVALIGYMGQNKARNTILSIYPEASSPENGLAILIFLKRFCEYFGVPEESVRNVIGEPARNAATWDPESTFFFDETRLRQLIDLLMDAKGK